METLFGIKRPEGPSAGEKALQRERYEKASKADAEADQKVALAARASSLRRSLAYRDDRKKSALGG
ncbi:hypothetical protein [Oricola cellulosilytica]|uniref:hypothetical protein n=1 Tax=Oricola cellulosilytica TaxID=1429082 RepID=UPI001304CD84|nr:hypothetical protein [Oricola cellulosilytica]